tara:strand:+ start:3326 stop:4369 length:1044 start_codon:yes stop_codon:yes gene_type:complete
MNIAKYMTRLFALAGIVTLTNESVSVQAAENKATVVAGAEAPVKIAVKANSKFATDMAAEKKAVDRAISVSMNASNGGWSIKIEEVYEKGDQLMVISRLSHAGGVSTMAIKRVSDKVTVKTAATKETHYILGKTFNWNPAGGYKFVTKREDFVKDLKGSKQIYGKAQKKEKKPVAKKKVALEANVYPHQVVVKFDAGLTVAKKAEVIKALEKKFPGIYNYYPARTMNELRYVRIPKEMTPDEAIKKFASIKGIKVAEKVSIQAPNGYVDRELILGFAKGSTAEQRKKAVESIKGGANIIHDLSFTSSAALRLPKNVTTLEGIRIYAYTPGVISIELTMMEELDSILK